MKHPIVCLVPVCLTLSLLASGQEAPDPVGAHSFRLTSTMFANNTTLPSSTINNIPGANGANTCTVDGTTGGNQSPELAWVNASSRTVSFVVIAFDTTASFTHWGMYNIPATTTELPENAGVAGSPYGTQIFNDFFVSAEYDGPCPPRGVRPFAHRYVFTVYALDIKLNLPSTPNFPPSAETLYQALIKAGRNHHILESATLTGLFSSTPPPPQ